MSQSRIWYLYGLSALCWIAAAIVAFSGGNTTIVWISIILAAFCIYFCVKYYKLR